MQKNEYANMYRLEDTYWYYRALHELLESFVQKEGTNKGSNLDILDVGCGTGKWLSIMNGYGNARGIDHSLQAVEYCRQRGLANVEHHDLTTFDYGTSRFDIITCIGVL